MFEVLTWISGDGEGKCLAHPVLSLENPQSFHKVNFILLFVTKTCVYQKPGYFFSNVWDMQWISRGL
jgi:hypothetical protein